MHLGWSEVISRNHEILPRDDISVSQIVVSGTRIARWRAMFQDFPPGGQPKPTLRGLQHCASVLGGSSSCDFFRFDPAAHLHCFTFWSSMHIHFGIMYIQVQGNTYMTRIDCSAGFLHVFTTCNCWIMQCSDGWYMRHVCDRERYRACTFARGCNTSIDRRICYVKFDVIQMFCIFDSCFL